MRLLATSSAIFVASLALLQPGASSAAPRTAVSAQGTPPAAAPTPPPATAPTPPATAPTPAAAPTPPAPAPRSAGTPAPSAKIAPLAFLNGAWSGKVDGSYVEETWSAPVGTGMVGSFRWLKRDGTPAMFEILSITQEGDDVRLRLRHFTATLVAKEPTDRPQTLKLEESGPRRAVFAAEKDAGDLERITYEVKDDVLRILVEFKASDPPRDPLRFELSAVR